MTILRKALISTIMLTSASSHCLAQGGDFKYRTIDHNGTERTYGLYVPSSYDGTEAWPLVLSFHGFGWDIQPEARLGHPKLDRMQSVADTAHFLVAYPQGLFITLPTFGRLRGWNVDGTYGSWDDVDFTAQMIDHISGEYAVDARRVHATGFSFGSMMSFTLACKLDNRIASVGGVSGPLEEPLFEDCTPTRPVSTLLFHGTSDPIIPIGGNVGTNSSPGRPIPETPAFWAGQNSCSAEPTQADLSDVVPNDNSTVRLIEYTGCDAGSEVQFYRIEGGGHTWPSSFQPPTGIDLGNVNRDIDASHLIWDFFKRHRKPTATNTNAEFVHEETPSVVTLAQNYPNPFNPVTTIVFKLEQAGLVELTIFDSFGRRVEQLASGPYPAGKHAVDFSGSGFSSGNYLYVLEAGGARRFRMLTILK